MVKKTPSNSSAHTVHPSTGGNPSTFVPYYQHLQSENVPLLPRRRVHDGISLCHLCLIISSCLAFFVFSFTVYHTSAHFMHCPPDPSTRDAVRRDWEREVGQHRMLEREWEHKSKEHAEIERDWKRASEEHNSEVARRVHEEHVRQARVREEWTRETQQHVREFEEMQRREKEQREEERQKWQREVEERDRREEEKRQKLNMFWGNVEAHTCTMYATRDYSAQLMNLPASWQRRVEACKATPLEIHGIPYLPQSCEDKGGGVVIGRWRIDQQEPVCTTFWEGYHDTGCTSPGSGKRHITHKLMNLPEKSDWREFCATTPIRFDHMEFPGAKECFKSTWGVYGQWEVNDASC